MGITQLEMLRLISFIGFQRIDMFFEFDDNTQKITQHYLKLA